MNQTQGGMGKPDKMEQMAMSAQAMDHKFVMDAAMGNMAEIRMGQMAKERATNPEVKNFAQMMIDHHTMANNDLMRMAQMKGMTLPTDVGPHHRAVMDGMSKLSGMEFDMAYVKHQMADHALAVDMYAMHAKSSKDGEVRRMPKRRSP
ncbi:MAG: DUF4142 domain-containing protein [Acidobacteria bacterium]|nr:DUF4142 domain-containing protein [Acidobacteriota bacterium]